MAISNPSEVCEAFRKHFNLGDTPIMKIELVAERDGVRLHVTYFAPDDKVIPLVGELSEIGFGPR